MTLEEIKAAVRAGKRVIWQTPAYEVIEGKSGFLIRCTWNGSAIGLTHADGVTMNGAPDEFFVIEGAS